MAEQFEAKVKVAVDAEQAKQQVGYLKTMMNQFSTEVTNRFVAIFSAAAVVKMGFDKVSQAMAHNLQIAKQISSLSAKFHIDPKQVHSIMMSAEQAGVSVRQLLMGMKALGNAASKAVVNKEFANAFKTMGIDAKNLGDMATKPAKSFAEVALKLSEIASETLRAEIGTKLLGRSYQQLAPLIDKLAESEEEREKFLNNPNAMDGTQVAQAKSYAKRQAEMKEGFEAQVANLMPVFQVMAATLKLILIGIERIFNWAVHFFKGDQSTEEEMAEWFEKTQNGIVKNSAEKWSKEIRENAAEKLRTAPTDRKANALKDWSTADELAFEMANNFVQDGSNKDSGFAKGLRGTQFNNGLDPHQQYIHEGERTAREDTPLELRERFQRVLSKLPRKEDGSIDLESNFFKDISNQSLKGGLISMSRIYNATKTGGLEGGKAEAKLIENEREKRYDDKTNKSDSDTDDAIYDMKNAFLTDGSQWVKANGRWELRKNWRSSDKIATKADQTYTEEKQKKVMDKLNTRAKIAERQKQIAGLDYDDLEAKAIIEHAGAKLDVEEAKEKLTPQDELVKTAKEKLTKAQEDAKKAYDAAVKAGPHDLALNQANVDAIEAEQQAVNELNAMLIEQIKLRTALTVAETKEKTTLDGIRKARESMQGKQLGETNEERSEKEELERKDFERSQKDKKLMGTPQQDLAEAQLGFDKKIMERRVKEFNDYFRAATERAKSTGGKMSEVDRNELVKKQKAVTNAKEKVEDSLYGMMHPSSMVVSDMRKIGGGGGVFGTPDVGMSVIEANRKKIPLLEAIEKNTRGVYVQGVRGAIDDSSLRPDNSPPINSR